MTSQAQTNTDQTSKIIPDSIHTKPGAVPTDQAGDASAGANGSLATGDTSSTKFTGP